MAFSLKPTNISYQRLFMLSLFVISISLTFLVLSFMVNARPLVNEFHTHRTELSVIINDLKWFGKKTDRKKVKVGLVNLSDDYNKKIAGSVQDGVVEVVSVRFARVDSNRERLIKWEKLFPEWVDEDEKWGPPKCPEIPMPPRMEEEEYGDLDVVVARVPCGKKGWWSSKEGIRDVYRLQVNLVVANLAVASGFRDFDRTMYVVFVGACGPMMEMFRCDDLVKHVGDFWLYRPDLRRLRQKVAMPVGSCKIASPLLETRKEEGSISLKAQSIVLEKLNHTSYQQREAYATILHSSEAYVCGAIALAQSLIQSNSTKDRLLLHDKTISIKSLQGLRAAGWKTRLIQRIRSPVAKKGSYNEYNYSKLRLWQQTDYDKIMFIDSDLLVLKNIDKFFDYPQLSAAPNNKVLFNSGLMLIEPSLCTFDNLMSKTRRLNSYNGGDQGFLNEAFTWWHRLPKNLNHLKVFAVEMNGKHEIPSDVYAIHFLGFKPWTCYRDYDCNWDRDYMNRFASDDAHKKWWMVHDHMSKGLQQYCALSSKAYERIMENREAAKKANLPNGHWRINVKHP
ncbi:putative UDP-glucuronate:xylan alpha-glucuronosyltransferase 5 [Tripterygium wilfordii]|uniref:putative UDP-glucuronate:xylan alpha-glucuronosyltransferase 5 n=1 Tax=Tripterygium wilfordii TaxID=458696 RepID=UPI0018F7F02C|nr:putative UDP-glucuronate:xylan alpha-glucuronosyltransferase 5 [Tripterygium wilfordii]